MHTFEWTRRSREDGSERHATRMTKRLKKVVGPTVEAKKTRALAEIHHCRHGLCHRCCHHPCLRMLHCHLWNPPRKYCHHSSIQGLHQVFGRRADYWYKYQPMLKSSPPSSGFGFCYTQKNTCFNFIPTRMPNILTKECTLQ